MDMYRKGFDVRISGQDVDVELFSSSCGRKVEDSEEEITLIDRLEGKKTNIYNSLLSEYGARI
jgi:2-oxoglutarate dehydrogenase E1 component